MNKSRVINVWIHPDDFDNENEVMIWCRVSKFQEKQLTPAKLTFYSDKPIKKLITDHEFDELYRSCVHTGHNSHSEVMDRMREKLFGNNK